MKFSDFLKTFKKEDTPIGDLARDFIDSKSRATTYKGVVKSMEKYCPCKDAWDTLESVYSKYLKQQEIKK